MTSKNNSNNQPQQQQNQQQANANQYIDFFPGFKLQKDQYDKVKTSKGKSWPRAESVLEKEYEIFVTDVVNPLTTDSIHL